MDFRDRNAKLFRVRNNLWGRRSKSRKGMRVSLLASINRHVNEAGESSENFKPFKRPSLFGEPGSRSERLWVI